jgi:hypothetical protein
LSLAQLAHARLHQLVKQVGPFLPVAEEATVRLAVATVEVLRRQRVDEVTRALVALNARRDTLRDPDAPDVDACAVVARLAERVGRALAVSSIRWPPKGGGPFDPPTLVEPEPTP